MAEKILGEAFATGGVVGGNGLFAAVVDVEAGVFPGEEIGELGGADKFGIAEGLEEAVAKEFDGGTEVFGGNVLLLVREIICWEYRVKGCPLV